MKFLVFLFFISFGFCTQTIQQKTLNKNSLNSRLIMLKNDQDIPNPSVKKQTPSLQVPTFVFNFSQKDKYMDFSAEVSNYAPSNLKLPKSWNLSSKNNNLVQCENDTKNWCVKSNTPFALQGRFGLNLAKNIEFFIPNSVTSLKFKSLKHDWMLDFGDVSQKVSKGDSIKSFGSHTLRFKRVQKVVKKAAKTTIDLNKPQVVRKDSKLLSLDAKGSFTSIVQIRLSRTEAELKAHYQLNVLHGKVFELKHDFPQDLELESIQFEPRLSFQYSKDKFIFPNGYTGKSTLLLQGKYLKKDLKIQLSPPHISGLKSLSGVLYFVASENVRIQSIISPNLVKTPFLEIRPLETLDVPVLNHYKYTDLPNNIIITKEHLPTQQTKRMTAKNLEAVSVLTEQGKIATSLTYTLQNLGAGQLDLPLPKNAQLLGAYVDSKPVKSFKNDSGSLVLHIPKSKQERENLKDLSIEVKYLHETRDGKVHLKAPDSVLPLKSHWTLYHPEKIKLETTQFNIAQSNLSNMTTYHINPLSYRLEQIFDVLNPILFVIIIIVASVIILRKLLRIGTANKKQSKLLFKIVIGLATLFLLYFLFLFYASITQGHLTVDGIENIQLRRQASEAIKPATSNFGGNDVFGDDWGNDFDEEIWDEKDAAPMEKELKQELGKRNAMALKSRVKRKVRSRKKIAKRKRVVVSGARHYRKIKKSGIKPVRIQFPKLSKSMVFKSNEPLEEGAEIVLEKAPLKNIATEAHNSFMFSLITVILGGFMLYFGNFMAFTLISIVFTLMAFSVITVNASTLPILFLGFIMFVLIKNKTKLFPSCLAFMLALNTTMASKPMSSRHLNKFRDNEMFQQIQKLQQNYQQQKESYQQEQKPYVQLASRNVANFSNNFQAARQSFERFADNAIFNEQRIQKPALPKSLEVYRIYDPKSRSFVLEDWKFVDKYQWEQYKRAIEKKKQTQNITVQSQKLNLSPDYKTYKLKIKYEILLKETEIKDKYFLFPSSTQFQLLSISNGKTPAKIEQEINGNTVFWYLLPQSGQRFVIEAITPIFSDNYGDDYDTSIPVVDAVFNELKYSNTTKYLSFSHSTNVGSNWYFDSSERVLDLEFSSSKPVFYSSEPQITVEHQRTTNRRSFVRREKSINCDHSVSWEKPWLIHKLNYFLQHTDSFVIPTPKDSILSELVLSASGKTLTQGIDYGLTLTQTEMKFNMAKTHSKLNLVIHWHTKDTEKMLSLPFDGDAFDKNSYKFSTHKKDGQNISFKESEQIKNFIPDRFSRQSHSKSYANISGINAPVFRLDMEEKTFVPFASIKCKLYEIKAFIPKNGPIHLALNLYLTNSGSQFLPIYIPEGTNVEYAKINQEHLNPALDKNGKLLLPLKKYTNKEQVFKISIFAKAKAPVDEKSVLYLPLPQTDVDKMTMEFSSNMGNIEFNEDVQPMDEGSLSKVRHFSYPMEHNNNPALSFKFPNGSHTWSTKHHGMPSEIKIAWKYTDKSEKESSPSNTQKAAFPVILLLILGAILHKFKCSKNKWFYYAVLCSIPFGAFVFPNSTFFFWLIMAVAWLLENSFVEEPEESTEE
jgi:hypothetical protein